MLDVRNNFIRTRFTVKSRERKSALFNGHTSRAYRRTGMHLLLTNCKNTSYEADKTFSYVNSVQHCSQLEHLEFDKTVTLFTFYASLSDKHA